MTRNPLAFSLVFPQLSSPRVWPAGSTLLSGQSFSELIQLDLQRTWGLGGQSEFL